MTGTFPAHRILLVEDDHELREAIADALTHRGHAVVAVDDGREGLARMREDPPDVVVLDLMMPVLDGWQFRVEQRRDPAIAETPVVAISASQSPTAAAVDADLFLRKPCSVDQLLGAIEHVLEARRRRAEPARLAAADRLVSLGTLAAGIAHEINNPLTYVLFHLHSVLRMIPDLAVDPSRADQAADLLRGALDGAERIRDITRGIRLFARGEQPHPETLDVRGPLEAALRLAGTQLRHRARLVREDGAVPFVVADEGSLAQVFLNLVTNAIHAVPEGADAPGAELAEIRIVTGTSAGGWAMVEIIDQGPGIPEHLMARVFEPFFTTKPVGEGTGLGLSISHGLVRAQGGRLTLDSAPGAGTTARVMLPPADARAHPDAHAAEDAPVARALVVEPDPDTRACIRAALHDDHDLTFAGDADHAVDLVIGGGRFDVMIYAEPPRGPSAAELVARIRRARPTHVPRLVIVGAEATAVAAPGGLDQVAHAHVDRPLDGAQLRAVVAALHS